MISVEVALFAVLRQYLPDPESRTFTYRVAPGTTARQLGDMLGIPRDDSIRVFINYRLQTPDYVLQDGDQVAFIPALAGG